MSERANIDELSIEIKVNADEARKAVTNLTQSLTGLSRAIQSINTKSISTFSKSVASLASTGRRIDQTEKAVKNFADTIAKDFGIHSKEGIDAIRDSMMGLAEAEKAFANGGERVDLGDKWEDAKREATSVIKSYARIKAQVDDTTKSVMDYVSRTNKGSSKVSVANMAEEFGENFKSMRSVLGKSFTSKLESTQKGVQDFAEYLEEMNGVLGTSFDTDNIYRGFEQLVDMLEKGRNATLSYSEAVNKGKVREEQASWAVGEYSDALYAIIKSDHDLKANNGVDALVESLRKLSKVELPDFTPFGETIKTLNSMNTDRVTGNITAIKQALDGTLPSSDKVKESLEDISNVNVDAGDKATAFAENLKKAESIVRDINDKTHKVAEGMEPKDSMLDDIGDSKENVDSTNAALENMNKRVAEITGRMKQLKDTMRSIESGENVSSISYDDAAREVKQLENELKKLKGVSDSTKKSVKDVGSKTKIGDVKKKSNQAKVSLEELSESIGKLTQGFNFLGNVGLKVLKLWVAPLKLVQSLINSVANKIKEKTSGLTDAFKKMRKSGEGSLGKLAKFWQRTMRTMTFMLVRKAIDAIIANIKGATDELALFEKQANSITNGRFNTSLSEIIADFKYIARAVVAAFEPLINFVVPAINAVASALANVLSLVGEFFAAFTGQDYFVTARKTVTDYGDSIDDSNKSLKEQQKLLLGIDELNTLPSKNDSSNDKTGAAATFKDAYDTHKVSDNMKNLAEKVKGILKDLFEPLEKAWDRAKKYVLKGFKYMTAEVGKLAKSIGSAFMEVWKQDETVDMLTDLFLIVGDLEFVVGNLARNFRLAWDAIDEGGKRNGVKFFEGLRNILATIISHVRNVTKYMKIWSQKIDFTPLLTSVNKLLESLNKLADFLGGVFEDVMQNIVLEHIRFLIEEGLPHLADTISEVIEAFDFKELRKNLEPVEKAFEQLRQDIFTGIVDAIGNVGKAVAEWTNSENFKAFLEAVSDFMSKITPERVEKLFTGIGLGLLKIVEGLTNFIASDEFSNFVDDVLAWYDSISAEDIANFFYGIAEGVVKIAEALIAFVKSDAFQWFIETLTNWFKNTDPDTMASQMVAIAKAILAFKFTAFVGNGIAGFIRIVDALKKLGALRGIASIAKHAAGAVKGLSALPAISSTSVAGVATLSAATVATGTLVIADLKNIAEGISGYAKAGSAYSNESQTAVENLKKVYETQGAKAAEEWAKTCYDIDISGQSLAEAQSTLTDKIDKNWEGIPKSCYEGFQQGWNTYFGEDGKGLFALVKDGLGGLITGVCELFGIDAKNNVFYDIGSKVVGGLQEGFSNEWASFQEYIVTPLSEFTTAFAEGGFGGLKDKVVEKFEGMKEGAVGKVNDLKDGANEKLEEMKTNASEKVQGFKDGVLEKYEGLKTDAVQKFNDLKSNITQEFGGTKDDVVQKASELKDNALLSIEALKTDTITKFDNIKSSASENFNTAKDSITQALETAKTNGTKSIELLVSSAKTKFGNVKKAASDNFQNVKDAISKKLDSTNKTVADKLETLKNKFKNINLKSVGSQIISDFISGLQQAWSRVTEWASRAVDGLKRTFSGALDINSPSKVFEKYGEYTVEGFNEGINNFAKTSKTAVNKWTSAIGEVTIGVTPDIIPTKMTSQTVDFSGTNVYAPTSSITKDDLNDAISLLGTKLATMKKEDTKIVLELDGQVLYQQVVKQDRAQMMRTGKGSFAY